MQEVEQVRMLPPPSCFHHAYELPPCVAKGTLEPRPGLSSLRFRVPSPLEECESDRVVSAMLGRTAKGSDDSELRSLACAMLARSCFANFLRGPFVST